MRYSRNVTSFLGIFAVCGPVTVSQAGQILFGGQVVPLGLFLLSTSPADRTWSPILDRAADTSAGGETQTSLFIACRCLRRRRKTNTLNWHSASMWILSYSTTFHNVGKLAHPTWLCLTRVCGHLTFAGDKLERVAEYSETRDSLLWAVIHKLVAQTVPTLATQNLHAWNTITSAVVQQGGLIKPTGGGYEMLSRTLKAVRDSIILVTLSSRMVSVKAGQGDEWGNLDRLENSGWLHWEHTYIPAGDGHC